MTKIMLLTLDSLDSQCFPFYTYNGTGRKENITDKTLEMYRESIILTLPGFLQKTTLPGKEA
ncbi:MAG: hypothetical protein R2883_00660 [Caldisericia bacterium]